MMGLQRYKIGVLGDSTALHRPRDGTTVNHTYMFKLAYEDHHIIFDKCIRAGDTSDFIIAEKKEDQYELDCDFFIIQLGICDCAPRLFSKSTKLILDGMSHIILLKKTK